MTPGIHPLSSDAYHAAPGISNSGLSIIAERTPAHYKASRENERVETPAMSAGKRLHCAVLEPHEFERIYVPIPKIDKRTNTGKAEQAAWDAANAGKLPINPDEREQVLRVRDVLHADARVRELLSGGHKERSIFAKDPETGVLTKCRPDNDKIIDGCRIITDLKSTLDASPEDFMWSAYRYGYFRQAPFYTDVCNWEGSEQQVDAFFFIAFEKEPPYGYIVYEAAPRFMARGRDAYRTALNTYAKCVETETWPCYDTDVHALDLPEAIHKRMDMADSDLVENISYVD
jgi:exodeoxyribonuclease VIII